MSEQAILPIYSSMLATNESDGVVKGKFAHLLDQLHEEFSKTHIDIDTMKAILESYQSNKEDWGKFTFFDPHRYTRNLVDKGNNLFNVMILCWSEGQGSGIHDHANAHCFVKILEGELKETRFEWPKCEGQEMTVKQVTVNKRNQVAYMCDEFGLHRMENPSHSNKAVSMHIYCPPFRECTTFDQKSGHARKCPVTFFSTFGKKTVLQKPTSSSLVSQ